MQRAQFVALLAAVMAPGASEQDNVQRAERIAQLAGVTDEYAGRDANRATAGAAQPQGGAATQGAVTNAGGAGSSAQGGAAAQGGAIYGAAGQGPREPIIGAVPIGTGGDVAGAGGGGAAGAGPQGAPTNAGGGVAGAAGQGGERGAGGQAMTGGGFAP